jgi:predicted Zn-dependent peptidase
MKPQFHRKVLKNGMTLIFEKRDHPVVSVAFAVKNGGVNESASEKGISHFIEHMLYKGTPTRDAKQIASEIEKKGGELNGFTDESLTAYWCKMPSKHLDIAFDVLSDMVKNPLFDEKELEKERKVIFEEIKMRKDTPQIYVFDEIQGCLYGNPLGLNLIGTYETMNDISRKKILEKFKQIYNPNNMILSVVGDADFDYLVDFAEKTFPNIKGKVPQFEIKKKNQTKIETRPGIDQANLIFAHHIPLSNDKKNYSAQVLSCLLAEGMSSRLFSEIREKRNLAYAVKGSPAINKDFAYSIIYVGTSKENVEKVKELILKEFEKVSKTFGEKEFKQVKEQMIGNYHISTEDSQRQMLNLLLTESIFGDAKEFYDFEKNISDVKIEDVKKIAQQVKDNYSFFALVPE